MERERGEKYFIRMEDYFTLEQRGLAKCTGGANREFSWFECNVKEMSRENNTFNAILTFTYTTLMLLGTWYPVDQASKGRLSSYPTPEGIKSLISCLGYFLHRCLFGQLMTIIFLIL